MVHGDGAQCVVMMECMVHRAMMVVGDGADARWIGVGCMVHGDGIGCMLGEKG